MEKIVISTSIGGTYETISDKTNGFHVVPNDPADLADKLRYALSILGTVEALKIGAAARSSAMGNFSLDEMLKRTMSVYNELL